MQRRAVAVYAVLFVLVGAAAGTLTATADAPEVSFDNPAFEGGAGDSFEHNGTTYTVTEVTEETEEGGHGATTTTLTGTVEWNRTVEESATWANDSVVEYDGNDWRVVIDGDDPDAVTLRDELDRTAILENDSAADNETVQSDGEEYVVVRDENGSATLVPAGEYFPEPEERQLAEGETIEYDGHDATVENVTASEARLRWETVETASAGLSQQGTVTLGGTDFVVIFQDSSTVSLSSNMESYEAQLAEIDQFEQRMSGLTRVQWVSLGFVVFLIAFAFMPSRY
ncbi:hypothetical protein [Halopenitus persicus]|uniref:Uncharacterized protein n=1 Tax=Halopenitus persicus TaxID=1048396 RepID=A0A1H3FQQ1_9EURY|nr:hypothetical protein [Halopenitus persicus]QHS16758.1 hypothetical protein GWK26_06145 [haloarchaeon 3A1-DGR]SDX93393.1 hypothetical protein SAMN05216564_102174 [Halopenitus persicus]